MEKAIDLVILASGYGRRLRPLTYLLPKVLAPVRRFRLIEWVYITSFRSDLLFRTIIHASNGSVFGFAVTKFPFAYSPSKIPTGTASPLKYIDTSHKLSDQFIVRNGDTISNIDLKKMLAYHKRRKADVTVFTKDDAINSGGTYILNKRILDYIPNQLSLDINTFLIPKLLSRGDVKVSCYNPKGSWYMDCGTWPGLIRAWIKLPSMKW